MRYFVTAADDDVARRYADRLERAGYEVVDRYDPEAILVSVGGDGSILYNARRYPGATVLPVVAPGSEGNKIDVTVDDATDRIAALETGREGEDYRVETHHKLGAYLDGDPVREGFFGMNDVHLHHASPARAAKFGVRIRDGDREVYAAEKAIGDGVLVATPFGSTAYYRSITGGTFDAGVGVAFNNLHKPADAPEYVVLSPDGAVEVELLATHGEPSGALYRDDDPDPYRPEPGRRITVRRSDRTVDVVRIDD